MLYEKNQNRIKLCALCENRIIPTHVVCEDHLEEMNLYRHEEWFITLCQMQQRQYEIDIEEFRLIRHGVYTPTLQKGTKPRSKLTQTDKARIINLKQQSLGWRKIARKLNLNPNTVRNFIHRSL